MESTGVCCSDNGWLHFVDERAKADGAFYVDSRQPGPAGHGCNKLLPGGLIFQQNIITARSTNVMISSRSTSNATEFHLQVL
jgi:hypothetical protein